MHAAHGRGVERVRMYRPKSIITSEEAYHGAAKIIEVDGQKIRIKLKPGTYDGLMIRLSGKAPSTRGQAGDLYLTIHIVLPNDYRIDGMISGNH